MSNDISQEVYDFYKAPLIALNSVLIFCLGIIIVISSVWLDETSLLVDFSDVNCNESIETPLEEKKKDNFHDLVSYLSAIRNNETTEPFEYVIIKEPYYPDNPTLAEELEVDIGESWYVNNK